MNMTKLETIEELEVLVEKNEPYVLFKHSTTCPISHGAYTEFQAYCRRKRSASVLLIRKMREMCQIVLQNNTVLDMNHRKCYT